MQNTHMLFVFIIMAKLLAMVAHNCDGDYYCMASYLQKKPFWQQTLRNGMDLGFMFCIYTVDTE